MASGDTALGICSDALLMIGAKAISSFTEGTDAANICDSLFNDVKKQSLMQYPWTFSFKKVQIARLATTPATEYTYEYQLPSDRIGPPRQVFIANTAGQRPINAYRILQDKLLTNETTVYVDYQYDVEPFEMPTYFVQFLKYLMAWHLSLPITDQTDKAAYWQSVAVGTPGENGRGGYFRTAISIDGQTQPNNYIDDYSLIEVRN